MKLRNAVLPSLAIIFCWLGIFTLTAFAKPRPPQPPWPQSTIKIFGFDSPYQKVPWRDVAFNEEESTLVESWSGYALERSGLFLSPIVIPVRISDKEMNLDPARGSIRFWLAPNWSTANEKSGGTGPGHLAHLLELVDFNGKASDARWALFLNEAGDTLHFVGQTKLGLTELLKVPVTFTAGDWRMITLCYSETNAALMLDGEVIAKGEGVMAPVKWAEMDLGLVVGSDVLASPDSLAEAQFEELTTMRQWPSQSDWQALYFQATKRRSLLGALGTKEDEQAKVVVLKAAGLLPEDYGLAKSGGDGDGPIVASSYAAGTLWLEITGVSNNLARLIVHGTVANTAYEVLSKTSFTNTAWAGEQPIVIGAAGQDWTPTTVTVGTRTNHLFLWARTLVDTDGDGLPDWWELAHNLDPNNPDTGNMGVSDGYKDSDNDGWNNLQEYQNGTNPSQFNTPAAPTGLKVTLSSGGTVAAVRWQPASGPVTGYTVERSFTNQALQIAANTTQVTDTTVVFPTWLYSEFEAPQFRLRANYAGGSSTWTPWLIPLECRTPTAQIVSSSGGTLLAVPDLGGAAGLRVGEYDYDNNGYPVSVTNVAMAPSSFVNGLAAAPEPFASGTFNGQGFSQAISANGIPSATAYLGWPAPTPLWDGRAQLKENLRFLLRVATPATSFGFIKRTGNIYDYNYASSPESYAYSSFYELYESGGYSYAVGNEFLPFEQNYLYRNFVFSPTNLYTTGEIRTGVFWDSGNLSLLTPEQFSFQPPATVGPITSVLTAAASQWTVWREDFPNLGSLPYWSLGVTVQNNQYHMTNGARNLFGLPYLSFQLAWGSNVTDRAVLSPGNNVFTNVGGYFYPETAQPAFQTVAYHFVRAYEDPLPGQTVFSPTNTSPVLITSVGQSFTIAGYAKLAVTNGYANTFGYLGQYFDKAYKTTNGVVLTNQTGILSPYGEFFPTEPGSTALVMMPDLDPPYGRGTAVVNVIKLQLDVNHDGVMDLSFAGPDNTSQHKPYTFWANSDRDVGERDQNMENAPRGHDYDDTVIGSMRDLEDFARLWILGLPSLPSTNGFSVTLSWRNVAGAPAIRLYRACETNGATIYLQNTNIAMQQIDLGIGFPVGSGCGNSLSVAPISATAPHTFPANFFSVAGTNKFFLFEGAGVGTGELVLTIVQGTNVIGETSAWLDLKDVKSLYEQVNIQDVTDTTPNNLVSVYKENNFAAVNSDEEKKVIVNIHGWRMGQWNYYSFSESMFKRLYWQGYHGRLVSVRWPTLSQDTDGTIGQFTTYNKSEFRAFQSGRGVSDYFTHLKQRFPDYSVSVCAHSMGNIVMAQALKLQLTAGQTNIDNYVLMQAAVPAHCYDTNLANYNTFITAETATPTPDTYRGYPGNINGAVGNRLVNFYNTNDFALATGVFGGLPVHWEKNEVDYKPDSGFGYSFNGTNAYKYSVVVTDPRQIMSFVARPRSKAVGAQPGVGGVIATVDEVNLRASFGFNDKIDEHSAQFNWNIQRLNDFYADLLTALFSQP